MYSKQMAQSNETWYSKNYPCGYDCKHDIRRIVANRNNRGRRGGRECCNTHRQRRKYYNPATENCLQVDGQHKGHVPKTDGGTNSTRREPTDRYQPTQRAENQMVHNRPNTQPLNSCKQRQSWRRRDRAGAKEEKKKKAPKVLQIVFLELRL